MKRRRAPQDAAELRRRAEKRQSKSPRNDKPVPPEADIRAIVHELQVHQIELEMQNEELASLTQELETNLEQYTVLYDLAPVGYLTLSEGGVIEQTNLAGAALLGVPRSELLGRSLFGFLRPNSLPSLYAVLQSAIAHGAKEIAELELNPAASTPSQIVRIELTYDESTKHHRVVMSDSPERKFVEQAMLDAGRRERQILGADLHDGLGQEITGLKLLLAATLGEARKAQLGIAVDLAQALDITTRALDTCRSIARGLSPLADYEGGLVQALRDLALRFSELHGPSVLFRLIGAGLTDLIEADCEHLFRIAQEALANAHRHGEACSIDVALHIQRASVTLTVTDDGHGFIAQAGDQGGRGLKMMRHRAEMMGAELVVESIPAGGTTVRCVCRLPADAATGHT